MNIKELIKERDEALLSLNKEKILAYMAKWEITNKASSEKVFWAGVHKAITAIDSATEEQKENSRCWLIENGFKPLG